MSIGWDFIAEHQFEMDFPYGMTCDKWTTKDGTTIRLNDMTEKHIRNCMCMVGEDSEWYGRFQAEMYDRATRSPERT